MHAVLITYHSAVPLDDLIGPFSDHAAALRGVPGLVAKIWLRDGVTLGGFYLFGSRQEADAYLDSVQAAGLTANPAFSQFQIRHFAVLDELSRLTGSARSVTA